MVLRRLVKVVRAAVSGLGEVAGRRESGVCRRLSWVDEGQRGDEHRPNGFGWSS